MSPAPDPTRDRDDPRDEGPADPDDPRDEGPADPMEVDTVALKALTHPLRVRMYDLLADGGPATASQLAGEVGESSGTTSYHLRVLARHGFIEEDPDRGDRRDRWWRVRPQGFTLRATRFLDDPEATADLRLVAGELWRGYARQLERWYRTAPDWDPDWIEASVSNSMRFVGTREEMRELRDEVMEVLQRHADRLADRDPPEGSVRITSQFHLFPTDPRDVAEPDDPADG